MLEGSPWWGLCASITIFFGVDIFFVVLDSIDFFFLALCGGGEVF